MLRSILETAEKVYNTRLFYLISHLWNHFSYINEKWLHNEILMITILQKTKVILSELALRTSFKAILEFTQLEYI